MSIRRYSDYVDTGLEWLGLVPAHWQLRRLGYFLQERREKVSDVDYPPLSVTKNGVVPQLETAAKTDDGDNRKRVAGGDFVINSRSDRKGSSGLSALDGSVSLINTVLTPGSTCAPRYIHHLLRSSVFQEEFYRFGKGIVADLWSTNYSEMKGISLAMPPLAEQTAIVAFLDRETGKIDALVEEQRRLIELLGEKRQAIISQAVTKGLDPNARMKPSGIELLGDVPEHWDVLPVKKLSSLTTSGPRGWSDLTTDEGHLFFQSQNIGLEMDAVFQDCKRIMPADDAESRRAMLMDDDVVVCITGGRTGAVAHLDTLPERTFINQHVCVVRPSGLAGRFLAYSLWSLAGQQQLALSMYGLKQGLALDDVRSVLVTVPPTGEQREIICFLDQQLDMIASLVRDAAECVRLLTERRASLISASVTGKIDVRATSPSKRGDRGHFRLIVGTEIVEQLAHKKAFGRVKLQKLLYLAEAEAGISELKGEYLREAAGPLDRDLIADVEARIQGQVLVEQPGGPGSPVTYRVIGAKGTYRQELAALLGDRKETLGRLIELLGDLDTLQVEAAATLYAIWNDALLDGRQPSDEEIVSGVIEDWHPEKAKKFRAEELYVRLGWMKRNSLVPRGSGPRTVTGRLFP